MQEKVLHAKTSKTRQPISGQSRAVGEAELTNQGLRWWIDCLCVASRCAFPHGDTHRQTPLCSALRWLITFQVGLSQNIGVCVCVHIQNVQQEIGMWPCKRWGGNWKWLWWLANWRLFLSLFVSDRWCPWMRRGEERRGHVLLMDVPFDKAISPGEWMVKHNSCCWHQTESPARLTSVSPTTNQPSLTDVEREISDRWQVYWQTSNISRFACWMEDGLDGECTLNKTHTDRYKSSPLPL